ncbi:putative protein phosphatase 2c 14 [Quercus suber]|uniref:Uncharacterized protein n=1 Tax=Quercus suber TaxID=58331 RepID=A0AAW0KNI5_QUESU
MSPTKESISYKMSKSTSNGLVAACEELVGLAVSRGSLDDITVMIIDLNHFRWLAKQSRHKRCNGYGIKDVLALMEDDDFDIHAYDKEITGWWSTL